MSEMAGKKETKSTGDTPRVETLFSKEQLLAAGCFQGRRDILDALLSPDERYTVSAAEQMIQAYMKKGVS